MAPAGRSGGSGGGGQEQLLSVVVCTTGRRRSLWPLLTSLTKIEDPDIEVVVVENSPRPGLVVDDIEALGVRHVWEPRRGLDAARNRGVGATSGDLIAYVDDDCEVDPGWVAGLRSGFADPAVGLVTGRVLPASLERPSQRQFQAWCSWDRGVEPFQLTIADRRPGFPASPHHLGTGCNMAFRRAALDVVGPFDEALDMGSLIGGGGDLDMFNRVLDAGYAAAYEPTAVVFHTHRRTQGALRWQVFGYGQAQGAVLAKGVVTRPHLRRQILGFWRHRWRVKAEQLRRAGRSPVRRRLVALEAAGLLLGPLTYLPSWVAARWRRR